MTATAQSEDEAAAAARAHKARTDAAWRRALEAMRRVVQDRRVWGGVDKANMYRLESARREMMHLGMTWVESRPMGWYTQEPRYYFAPGSCWIGEIRLEHPRSGAGR